MKKNKKLDEAISKLADLWPEDGELLASTNPIEFIDRVRDEIIKLRTSTIVTVISELTDNVTYEELHLNGVVPTSTMQFEIDDTFSPPDLPQPSMDEWEGVKPPPSCPCDWPNYGRAGACQCCHELWPRLKKAEATLSHLVDWSHQFGEHLCPRHRADTYGEGVRQMKEEVSNILSRK